MCADFAVSSHHQIFSVLRKSNHEPYSYLVMFRPPARELCLDTLEEIYNTRKTHSYTLTLLTTKP